jgi:hypothetical protein
MSLATAMYHSARDPLHKLGYKTKQVYIPRKPEQRRLQKALLRYHDAANWPVIRKALVEMGRAELIGDGDNCLIPADDTRGKRKGSHQAPGRRKSMPAAKGRKTAGRGRR